MSRSVSLTLAYLDLACVTMAAGLWYLFPELGALLLVVALAPWLTRWLLTGQCTARTPFDVPLLIFLIMAGVSVWSAFDREGAWAKFWIVVGGILLFYAFSNAILADPATMPRWLAWFLALLGIIVSLYFLATNDWTEHPGKIAGMAGIGQTLQARLPTLPGHRLHPNVVGGILAVIVPFAASAVLDLHQRVVVTRRSTIWMGLGLLLLAAILFGLFMSSSRGAWLGIVATTLLAFWWRLSASFTRSRPAWHAWLFLGLLTIQAVALIPLASSQVLKGTSPPVVGLASAQNYDAIDSRAELYRNSLILALDYPFLGAGLDSFTMLYSTYSYLIHVGHSSHSHNLFLDIAIQQGLLALLALLCMWAFVAKEALRPVSLGLWQGAAAFSLVTIAIHGLMDDALYGSRAVLLLFVPLAFFGGEVRTARGRLTGTSTRSRPCRLPMVAIVVLGIVAGFWYGPLSSQWYSNVAAVEQSRVELSAYAWPAWPLQDELRRQLDIRPAVAHYERALALNARNPSANRRLGQIELSLGEYEAALIHLKAAYEVTPWDNATRQLLGEAYLVNGHLAEGRALWSTIDATQKQLEIRAYWYEHIGDAQRLSWIQSSLNPLASQDR